MKVIHIHNIQARSVRFDIRLGERKKIEEEGKKERKEKEEEKRRRKEDEVK